MVDVFKEEVKENVLQKAISEREKLEKLLEESKKVSAELQELRAINILSGKTQGGQQELKLPEETPQEYAKRIMGRK